MPSSSRPQPERCPSVRTERLQSDAAATRWSPRLVLRAAAPLRDGRDMHELRDGSDMHELRDRRDAQADLACVASGDWDLLFRAVQQRLWQALVSVAPTAPASLRAAEQMLALECVDIIEKLYRMLVDTRRRGGPVAVGSRADDGRRRGETLQRL